MIGAVDANGISDVERCDATLPDGPVSQVQYSDGLNVADISILSTVEDQRMSVIYTVR